jgi:hypothetical protein
MKFYSQSHIYECVTAAAPCSSTPRSRLTASPSDPWSIVSLAFFLRYPNPYAAHVVSCDVVARDVTPAGTLRTTRLILKRGALPRWAPRGMVSKAESWILEESEVDPAGQTVRCATRNLDHVKIMSAREEITLHPLHDGSGRTMHTSTVNIVSRFGWGLTSRIEEHGVSKFAANLQKSRDGLAVVMNLLRQQPMALGLTGSLSSTAAADTWRARQAPSSRTEGEHSTTPGRWANLKRWFRKEE